MRISFLLVTMLASIAMDASAAQQPRSCGYPNVVFINGINNSETAAAESADALTSALSREISDFGSDEVDVALAYNGTGRSLGIVADLIESLYQKGATYGSRTEAVSLRIYGALNGLHEHLRDAPPGFLGDVKSALQSVFGEALQLLVKGKPAYDETLTSVVSQHQDALAHSPGVFTVAHSQGSLFANDAWYVLDSHEPSLQGSKRAVSGGYFVAPAAAIMYPQFISGYTKARTDFLAVLGIGLTGNIDFFASPEEESRHGNSVDSLLRHGFNTTYLNWGLASGTNKSPTSPPHARMYRHVADELKSALEPLKVACEKSWTLAVDTQHEVIFRDPLMVRDAAFCAAMGEEPGATTPASREACFAMYNPQVARLFDQAGTEFPLNWNGVCHEGSGQIACSLETVLDTGGYEVFIQGREVPRPLTCPAGMFELRTLATGAVQCLDWPGAMPWFQGSPLTGGLPG